MRNGLLFPRPRASRLTPEQPALEKSPTAVDQYATGSNNSIQFTNVNLEIDTVLMSLAQNIDRKFMFVEQAFFQRWWEAASSEERELMQQVVAAGQMEFVNGGWCMHDESSPSYVDMVDQTTLGHRLIKQQFGVVPKVTWQMQVLQTTCPTHPPTCPPLTPEHPPAPWKTRLTPPQRPVRPLFHTGEPDVLAALGL